MTTGYGVMPTLILEDPRVTGNDILVLVALSSWSGCTEISPSHSTIAKRAHVSVNTVGRALEHLRQLGMVEWRNQRRADGGQTSNVYRIINPWIGSNPTTTVGDPPSQSGTPPLPSLGDEVTKKEVTKRKKAERPLPADWQPNDKHRAAAEEAGLEVAVEAAKFRNHAEMHDRRVVLWDKAFNYWLINAAKYAAENGQRTTREPASYSPWSQ